VKLVQATIPTADGSIIKVSLVAVDTTDTDTIDTANGDIVPLTLPTLVAYCKTRPDLQHGASFEIHRLSTGHTPLQITNQIVSAQPDLLFVSLQVWSEEVLSRVICRVAAVQPEVMIAVTGPQVSDRAEQLLTDLAEIDLAVSGEGELAFAELVGRLIHRQVPTGIAGTSWRAGDGGIHTAPAPPPLPFATFDDMPSPYLSGATGPLTTETAYVVTARGCHLGCGYCQLGASSGPVRYRDLDAVEQELAWLRAQGVHSLVFIDPLFNSDSQRALAILDIVERLGFARVSMQVRAELLEEQLVEQLARCHATLDVGFESTDPEVCRRAGHELALDKIRDGVRLLQNHGVAFKVNLICGLPGDTFESLCDSVDEVLSWHPDRLEAHTLRVLPGTRFHAEADRFGLCFDRQPPHEIVQTTSMPYADLVDARALAMMVTKVNGLPYFRQMVNACTKQGVRPSTVYGELAYQAVADGLMPLDQLLDPHATPDSRQLDQLASLLRTVIAEQQVEVVQVGPEDNGHSPSFARVDDQLLMGWEITRSCNLKCPHCFTASTMLSAAEDPPLAEARSLLEQMAEVGVQLIGLSGGEPMLRRDLEKIIDYSREVGIAEARVVSNGLPATPKRLRSLIDAGLVGIQVSIDGPEAQLHSAVRGCKPRLFDITCANVAEAVSLGLDVSIACFLSRWASRQVPEMAELARRLGVRALRYCAFMPRGRGGDQVVAERVAPSTADLQVFTEQLADCQQHYDDLTVTVDHGFGPTPKEPYHQCFAGIKVAYLEANGDLYPCPGLIAPPFLIGNTHRTPLAEMLCGAEIRRTAAIERHHLREPCCSCTNHQCSGGCRGMSWVVDNEVLAAFPGCLWRQGTEY
jgi:radical SAM protein with 4Fe4S-binding SPASM domain